MDLMQLVFDDSQFICIPGSHENACVRFKGPITSPHLQLVIECNGSAVLDTCGDRTGT